jgi:hypothetical protein
MRLPIVTVALAVLASLPSSRLHAQQDTTVKWYDRFRFDGDIRVRFDYISNSETADRGRARIRVRTGFTVPVSRTVTAGLRLATAEQGSVTSTNINLSGAFTLKNIALDRAYITWTPSPRFTITGGKFAFPVVKPAGVMRTEMVFDEDVAPEGFHEQVTLVTRREGLLRRVAVLGEQWSVRESGSGPDTWMLGGQVVTDLALSTRVSATVTGGYYGYVNGKRLAAARNANEELLISNSVVLEDGTVLEGGQELFPPEGNPIATFVNDFELLNANAGITVDRVFGSMPLQLYVDVVHNAGASSERTGYWVGLTAGALRRRGDWTASAVYARVPTEAVLSIYNYSDLGLGGTNNTGPIFQVQYRPGKDFTLSARHHIMSAVNEATGFSSKPVHRLLLDAGVSF